VLFVGIQKTESALYSLQRASPTLRFARELAGTETIAAMCLVALLIKSGAFWTSYFEYQTGTIVPTWLRELYIVLLSPLVDTTVLLYINWMHKQSFRSFQDCHSDEEETDDVAVEEDKLVTNLNASLMDSRRIAADKVQAPGKVEMLSAKEVHAFAEDLIDQGSTQVDSGMETNEISVLRKRSGPSPTELRKQYMDFVALFTQYRNNP